MEDPGCAAGAAAVQQPAESRRQGAQHGLHAAQVHGLHLHAPVRRRHRLVTPLPSSLGSGALST